MTDINDLYIPLIPVIVMAILGILLLLQSKEGGKDAIIAIMIGSGVSAWAYCVLALALITLNPPFSYAMFLLSIVCYLSIMGLRLMAKHFA